MRRVILWVVGILLLLPFALMALVLLVANLGLGQWLIESQVASLTGGTVVVHGFGGRFPDALRLRRVELRDTQGAWLTLEDVALDWSPLALIGGDAHVEQLSLARLSMPRLPLPSPAKAQARPAGKGGFNLPVSVDIDALQATRIELGAPVALKPAVLKLEGAAHVASLDKAKADIALQRVDGPGSYQLTAALNDNAINAHLTAREPSGGFVSGLANVPGLGAIALDATINGPRTAEQTTIALDAGDLRADVKGTVDLSRQSAVLDLDAAAPAMAPRPDVSWSGITVHAHIQGLFRMPDVAAHSVIEALKAGGAQIDSFTLDASGNQGAVQAKTTLAGLVLPGPKPRLFADSPLTFTADARLDDKTLPIQFTLQHTLVSADGTANAGGNIAAHIHTVVPDLAPLAAIGNADIRGHTEATASLAVHGQHTDISLDGTADFTGGQAPVPALLGHTIYGATASLVGQDITISRAVVDGKAVSASVTGTDKASGLDLAWKLALSDLQAVSTQARGALTAQGHVQGPQTGLAVQAQISGKVGTASVPEGPLTVSLAAANLPVSPSGTVKAEGRFDGAPVLLNAAVERTANGMHAKLNKASWKSFAADADVTLPKGAKLPEGSVNARMSRLADLEPVLHKPVAGNFDARIGLSGGGQPTVKIAVSANGVSASGAGVGRTALTGMVRDPLGKTPEIDASLALTGIDAPNATGVAHVTAAGPLSALALHVDTNLLVAGAPATLTTATLLDIPGNKGTLQSLTANYKNEPLRLAAPAHIIYGGKTAVDSLRLALGTATISLSGSVSPLLDVTASVRNVTPDLAKPFAPALNAAGVLTADARLTGTPAAPSGTVRLQANGVRMRTGPAASLPSAALQVNAALAGGTARIDARAGAGPKLHLAANGTVPVLGAGALAMHLNGGFDLTLLNPVLNAGGRRAAGMIALDAAVGGSSSAPRINGGVTLAGGEIQDFVQGLRIEKIAARIDANGDTVTIRNFSGEAGPGTLSASGTVGVLAPGIPVNLHIGGRNARPLASDLLTAFLDMDIGVTGQAAGNMQVEGKIFIRRAEINIPNSLPPSVATLNVRYPGDKPPRPAPAAPPAEMALNLEVDAPNGIFVRGHGLDSELGGKLTVGGSAAAPQISGGFQMRRGDISVAGTTLNFNKGEVGFDGTSVTNKIDPTLDFVAESTSQSVDATLTVGGYADAPKITLSSVPDLPQDEVLAHLLFQRGVKDLSAVQIAEIAAALAELSGVTGGGGDPLAAVRKGLGLDRLSVGGGSGTSNGASVEAGRYVARGVFVGAKQNSSGGTAAEVQVDLTKRLKLTSQLASGGGSVQGATPDNDPGSTVGLSYGFDY